MTNEEWVTRFARRVFAPFERLGSVTRVIIGPDDFVTLRARGAQHYSPLVMPSPPEYDQTVGSIWCADLLVRRTMRMGDAEVWWTEWRGGVEGRAIGCVHLGMPAVPSHECTRDECVVASVLSC